jgi:ATP-dependent DNA helicase RecQ
MQDYTGLSAGHMAFLIKALDGDPGGASRPPLPPLPCTVDPAMVREAIAFLRRTAFTIAPRKQWPPGGMPHYGLRGPIPRTCQAEPGRALCAWGDPGWGALVRKGKVDDGVFADALVEACAALVQAWRPEPSPEWVTCIPSLRRPTLVPSFCTRLAGALGIPFHGDILRKTVYRPEQKSMANSVQQARNIDGSLAVAVSEVPSGAVLLVDDAVDSRWTITVAAWLLRSSGSGPVVPLALAITGTDE